MDFRQALSALRSNWWLPLVGVVVGVVAGVGYCVAATPMYSAQTQLFVSTTDASSSSNVLQGSQFSEERVASYAELIMGKELAGRVRADVNPSLTVAKIQSEISAEAVANTVLLDVTVTDASAAQAQRIARVVGDDFTQMVSELEAPNSSGVSPVRVTVTESPDLPTTPSSPLPKRDVPLGAGLGLLLGVVAALIRSAMDRSIKDPNELSSLGGAPVIGAVIRDESIASRHVFDRQSVSRVAEDYRQLRTNLQFLDVDSPPKVIMVSSPMPAEGKTTVVINLALALSEIGKQVTVVEADLRRPRVTRYLGLVSGVGLTNILTGAAEIGEILQSFGDSWLSVIGAGPTPPNPGQLLASTQMSSLIAELREKNDYILIDAPPLLPVADSTGLAVVADGVLLSVRFGRSRKDQLVQATEGLERVGARVLGLILNIVPPKAAITSAYGYGYSYGPEHDGPDGVHRL